HATRLLWLDAGRVRYAGPLRAARLRAALRAVQATARPAPRRPRRGAAMAARRARPLVTRPAPNVYAESTRRLRVTTLPVRRGECWVVHGANGAGKSTLLRTLYGDLGAASGGRIIRAVGPGVPLDAFRARTGLIAPHLQTDYPRHHS